MERRPPREHDDEEVERHVDADDGQQHPPREHVRLPPVWARLAVSQADDAQRDHDDHPVLAVDEQIGDQVVGGIVLVARCEQLHGVSKALWLRAGQGNSR